MNFSLIAFTIHVKPSWGRGGRRGKWYKLRQFGFFPLSPKGSLNLIVWPCPGSWGPEDHPACSEVLLGLRNFCDVLTALSVETRSPRNSPSKGGFLGAWNLRRNSYLRLSCFQGYLRFHQWVLSSLYPAAQGLGPGWAAREVVLWAPGD